MKPLASAGLSRLTANTGGGRRSGVARRPDLSDDIALPQLDGMGRRDRTRSADLGSVRLWRYGFREAAFARRIDAARCITKPLDSAVATLNRDAPANEETTSDLALTDDESQRIRPIIQHNDRFQR